MIAQGVAPGGETTIWGAGFKVLEIVSITVNGDKLVGGLATTDGAFEFKATVKLDPGVYTLKAVGDDGTEASAPLLVVVK